MRQEQVELIKEYMSLGFPILIDHSVSNIFQNPVILDSKCEPSELNGHYEKMEFVAPDWYQTIQEKSKTTSPILIIQNINQLPLTEQTKFIEILKYKKVSTFPLPKNCVIVVTFDSSKENLIHEEVSSLLAKV